MPTFPDRTAGNRPRTVDERVHLRISEGARREKGPSGLISLGEDSSLGRAPESGRRSESRRTDSISQGLSAKERGSRHDRYDRGESHGRDGSGSYPSSRPYAGTASLSSPTSRVTEEELSTVFRDSKEGLSSPAFKPSKGGVPSSVHKTSNGERPYSASRPIKEENNSPAFEHTNGVSPSKRSTPTREESRSPASKPSKGGSHTPRLNGIKTETVGEEDEDSLQRLTLPSHGTAGHEVNLQTNCFEITLDASVQLYQYHVHVVPEPETARQRKRAFDLFLKEAGFLRPLHRSVNTAAVATDYRSALITTERINPQADKEHDRHQCIVTYYEAEEGVPRRTPSIHSYMFTACFCHVLTLQKLKDYLQSPSGRAWSKVNGSTLHALSLVVARRPLNMANNAQNKDKNSCFPDAKPLVVLEGGLVALQGFQKAVKIMGSHLFVNVNPRIGIYYREDKEGSLLVLMAEFLKTSKNMGQLQDFVKGIRVNLPHLSSGRGKVRIETISGLACSPTLGANANQASFCWNNKEITVGDYFKQRYNISLKASAVSLVNVGTVKRPSYVPPELCKVLPSQKANKPLSREQQRKLAKALKQYRQDTISTIGESAKALTIGTKDSQGLNFFGLKIEPSVLTIKGRVLPAPPVQYDGVMFRPDFGSWNLKGERKFMTGARISRWTYLQIQNAGRSTLISGLADFVKGLQRTYASTICEPAKYPRSLTLSGTSPEYLFATVDKFIGATRANDTNTLLVILPDKSHTLFACIKYIADVKYGIQTICIEAGKMQKHIEQSWYAATIAQKLNTKGGGLNQILPRDDLIAKSIMIVGIDLTNPFPKGEANAAISIIGVVASKDRYCVQWPASVRRQENPEKVALDIQEMIIERLECWRKTNDGRLPFQVLVYRNGVTSSDSTVLDRETKAIDDAISSVYLRGALPKVTIMTISKSHHTRFFPADKKAADGQSGNLKVGTVVDRDITSKVPWEFYLQSHPGTPKSGTVRPAHYVVIKDDMKLGVDGVQKLTNNLCYLSARGTRALSIVPPAYYANLVCERARCYIQACLIPGRSRIADADERLPLQWTAGVHPQLRDSMWYI